MAEHSVSLNCGLEGRDKDLVQQCLRLMVGGILGLRQLQVPFFCFRRLLNGIWIAIGASSPVE